MSGDQWKSCYTCRDYAEHRHDAIAQPLADKARRESRDVIEVVDEFMWAAHERHMSGEALRPGGPTQVTNPVTNRMVSLMMLGRGLERDA